MVKVIAGLIGVMIIVGGAYVFLRGSEPPTGTQQTATTTPLATQTQTEQQTQTSTNPNPPKNIMSATLHTSMGDIVIEFLPQQAPNTVANFIKLAQNGFYDQTKFHRIIKGFMNQGGDPLTKDDTKQALWGTGGPGYQFADEITAANHNVPGTLSMANAGPNTNGSQFFINVGDNGFLDGKHTVFGRVVKGMEVVKAMNSVQTGPSDRPTTPVVLLNITLQ